MYTDLNAKKYLDVALGIHKYRFIIKLLFLILQLKLFFYFGFLL